VKRGRLRDPHDAPAEGETATVLAEFGNVVVEQILTGRLRGPADFDQPQDEWVVVLAGGATLEVAGEQVSVGPGDWVLLPARTPHRLVHAEPGTSWLAVHRF
jgi:cupin 2 domain-containing protein